MTLRIASSGPAAPGRAEILLAATNQFLRARDLDDLAATIAATAEAIFEPWKTSVTFRDAAGRPRLVVAQGFSGADRARLEARLADPPPEGADLTARVWGGEEVWTDDPDGGRVRDLVAAYRASESVILPIAAADGVVGILELMFGQSRTFDDAFRAAARALVAQAGLAYEMIAAREDLRRTASALERRTEVARSLFEIGQRLSQVDHPEAVPARLAAELRGSTGASLSLVARWRGEDEGLEIAAAEGFGSAEATLRALELHPGRYRMVSGGFAGRSAIRVAPFDPADLPLELTDRLGITAVGGAPIVIDGQPWGLVAVATLPGDPDLAEAGPEILAGLATIGASALARAAAVEALRRQADVLESTVTDRTHQLTQVIDELRSASQAKTDFLTNVSHELRTPLTAILGFSDVLAAGLDGPLSTDQLEDVRTIQKSAHHLLDLIDNLIDISRLEAGRAELRLRPVEVGPLVAAITEEIRPLASQKGQELAVEIGAAPIVVHADRSRLRQILLNVIGNALRFTPAGGRIGITVLEEGDEARIEVADTGIGIPATETEAIFEKFHRLAGPEHPGTGLGLALARQFARLHGGDVSVESAVGKGSTFTVSLPIEASAADIGD